MTMIQTNALADLYQLSSADMQGRENNTRGSDIAQQYLVTRYRQLGIQAFTDYPEFRHRFIAERAFTRIKGTNVIGFLESTKVGEFDRFIVITAHYDHLGIEAGKTFYGADDNASGVSALLALAAYARHLDLRHGLIFLATDAEEKGLLGARAVIKDFPIPLAKVAFNLNLDMIAQVGKPAKIHLSGTRLAPQFETLLVDVRSRLTSNSVKLMGEHSMRRKRDSMLRPTNYRRASDHAAFFDHDIPYLYLGVTEHRYYHTDRDHYENIDEALFLDVIEIAKQILITADIAMYQAEISLQIPQPTAAK